jgi:hypothetical protein
MLHAYRLRLPHPTKDGEEIDICAEPPKDFSDLLETLRKTYF